MRGRVRCAMVIALVCAAATAGARAQTTTTSSATKGALTLTGCVARDAADATHFTLADVTTGETTYRLTGAVDVRKYLGKRVSVSGSRVEPKVVGGLFPSPNIAAQAGAIDPTRAAMAAQGAEGNTRPGTISIPEVRVRTVREASGACLSK